MSCDMSACMAEWVAGAGTRAKPVQQRVNEIVSGKGEQGMLWGRCRSPAAGSKGGIQRSATRRNYARCCCAWLPCHPAADGPLTSRWLMAAPAG